MTPQTWFLDKLPRTEVASVVLLCSCDVVHGLQMVNQQSSLGKLGVALVTVVVRVAEPVLVQLEGGQESLSTLSTRVALSFACFCGSSGGFRSWETFCLRLLKKVQGGCVSGCERMVGKL